MSSGKTATRQGGMEELRAHCERCYDDTDERLLEQRERPNSREAWKWKGVEMMKNRVDRVRGR